MVLTIPLGRRRRLLIGRNNGFFMVATTGWDPRDVPRPDVLDDEEGGAAVREPRRPLTPLRGGAVALPLDDQTLE